MMPAESAWRGWQDQFDGSECLTCVLNDRFQVVYCNPAWDRSANINGVENATGARLAGRPLLQYVPRVLEYHYSRLLHTAREKRSVVHADYECNSPNVYRRYRMEIAPIADSSLLAITHTMVQEGSIPYHLQSPVDHDYGFGEAVTMCAQCRRTKLLRDNVWNWVREFVETQPQRVSFGLCDDCITLYCRGQELG
jgi:hypothetical protein